MDSFQKEICRSGPHHTEYSKIQGVLAPLSFGLVVHYAATQACTPTQTKMAIQTQTQTQTQTKTNTNTDQQNANVDNFDNVH